MRSHVIVSCEHAGWAVPPGVELGIDLDQRRSHIGWDPGAAPFADSLGAALGVAVFRGVWSRLVVDLNRRETDPGVIATVSGGITIPGNVGLDPEAREARLARWHRPWRAAVGAAVDDAVAAGGCVHVSVHSFDPGFVPGDGPGPDPARADLSLGVLFDPARPRETRLAAALLRAVRDLGCAAGENRPYAGTAEGFVTWLRERHGDRYVGLELELCQGAADLGPVGAAVAGVMRRFADGDGAPGVGDPGLSGRPLP